MSPPAPCPGFLPGAVKTFMAWSSTTQFAGMAEPLHCRQPSKVRPLNRKAALLLPAAEGCSAPATEERRRAREPRAGTRPRRWCAESCDSPQGSGRIVRRSLPCSRSLVAARCGRRLDYIRSRLTTSTTKEAQCSPAIGWNSGEWNSESEMIRTAMKRTLKPAAAPQRRTPSHVLGDGAVGLVRPYQPVDFAIELPNAEPITPFISRPRPGALPGPPRLRVDRRSCFELRALPRQPPASATWASSEIG